MPTRKLVAKEKAQKYERARLMANKRSRRYKARKCEEQLARKREQDRKRALEKRKHLKDMNAKQKRKKKSLEGQKTGSTKSL